MATSRRGARVRRYAPSVLAVLLALFVTASSSADPFLITDATTPSAAASNADPLSSRDVTPTVDALRHAHPEAAWPHWFADGQLAWGAVGVDGGPVEGLVATDGTISPIANEAGMSLWLRDDLTGHLYVPRPEQVSQRLSDGHLPLITSAWTAGPVRLESTVFAEASSPAPIKATPGSEQTMLVHVTLHADGPARPWTLYLAVRPYGPAGGVSALGETAVSSTTVEANDNLLLVSRRPADSAAALNETAIDASVVAAGGRLPSTARSTSNTGLASALLGFHTQLGGQGRQSYSFALPMQAMARTPSTVRRLAKLDAAVEQPRVAAVWQQRLHQVALDLPDGDIVNAFYASLAYMLMAHHDAMTFSGPLSERAFWVRDAAYTTAALDVAGFGDVARPVLGRMLSTQLPSGRFPPILNTDGRPRQPLATEWDAQGEAIYALVDFARQSRDTAWLHAVYPSIVAAAAFQQQQLQATRVPALLGTPFYGILPAGKSAEDLYNADWHHYWDDFWAMAGFQEAATAATLLGEAADVAMFTHQEDAVRAAVVAGVNQVRTPDGHSFIPNGPEDRTTWAMARSATPAIWPVNVLESEPELVVYSFTTYYQQDVKPYGGAYQHYNGHYWPYADVSLAHAFYQIGMRDHAYQILDWAMAHQTAPHLYAWAEVIKPETSTFALGDMPHSWMSAEMVLLIRDMLVRESGDHLDLGPYPDAWLPAGGHVAISDFPTSFGPLGYTLRRSPDGRSLDLLLSGTPPRGGYVLALPGGLSARSLALNDGPAKPATGLTVALPPGTRHAVVTAGPA